MNKFIAYFIIAVGLFLIFISSNNYLYSAMGSVFLLIKILPKK